MLFMSSPLSSSICTPFIHKLMTTRLCARPKWRRVSSKSSASATRKHSYSLCGIHYSKRLCSYCVYVPTMEYEICINQRTHAFAANTLVPRPRRACTLDEYARTFCAYCKRVPADAPQQGETPSRRHRCCGRRCCCCRRRRRHLCSLYRRCWFMLVHIIYHWLCVHCVFVHTHIICASEATTHHHSCLWLHL